MITYTNLKVKAFTIKKDSFSYARRKEIAILPFYHFPAFYRYLDDGINIGMVNLHANLFYRMNVCIYLLLLPSNDPKCLENKSSKPLPIHPRPIFLTTPGQYYLPNWFSG